MAFYQSVYSFKKWVVLGLVLWIHVIRVPGSIAHPQFWAEDGRYLFAQDYAMGWDAILTPFAGYLHLWPRLVAFGVGFFPLLWGPFLYKIGALFTHGVLIRILLSARFPGTWMQKVWMAFGTILLPQGGEVLMNLTNTNSMCALILIAILVTRASTRRFVPIVETIALWIASMTGPFILFLYPIFIAFILLKHESLQTKAVRITALTLGFLIQLCFFTVQERMIQPWSHSFGGWIGAFEHFFTPFLLASIPAEMSHGARVFCAILIFSALLIMGIAFGARKSWKQLGASPECFLFVCLFAIHGVQLYLFRSMPELIHPFRHTQRYFYVPYVLLLSGLILMKIRNIKLRILRAGMIAVSFGTSLLCFQSSWQQMDFNWPEQVSVFQQTGVFNFKILPESWTMHLDQKLNWRQGIHLW